MSENEPEIRQAVMEWVAAAGAAGDDGRHPDAETLAAYHARELSEDDERRVQDHLLVCRECAELLLDLEGLGDPNFGRDVEIPAGTGEALWQRLRQEVRAEPRRETVLPFAPHRRAAPPAWMSALAAALLVAVLGLSVWVATLRQTIEKKDQKIASLDGTVKELSQPEVNAKALDLGPIGTGTRDGNAAPDHVVPSGKSKFTVILASPQLSDFQGYDVELVRADGRVFPRQGLQPDPALFNSFVLSETRQALGAGVYRARLFGLRNGKRELLGEYEPFRIEP